MKGPGLFKPNSFPYCRGVLSSGKRLFLLNVLAIGVLIIPLQTNGAGFQSASQDASAPKLTNKEHVRPTPEKPKEPPPAKLKISGYGLLGNRELKKLIQLLVLS